MEMVNRPYVDNSVFHKNYSQFKNWRQDKNRKRLKNFMASTGNKHKCSCESTKLVSELHFQNRFNPKSRRRTAGGRKRKVAAPNLFAILSITWLAVSCSPFGGGMGNALWNVEAYELEGTHTSYVQHRKWYPSSNSTIQFEFLTRQPDGVLLYTDDGGYYDFIEIKLVDGSVRLRYNLGGGARVLHAGKNLHIGGQWHSVKFIRMNSLTILKVDGENATSAKSIIIKPRRNPSMGSISGGFDGSLSANVQANGDMNFGNHTTNSYVYMGGLPSWYTTKLSSLALPSVVFEPRFRGSIRNVVFADDKSGRPRRQEIMAYKGVRASTADFCAKRNPCENGGICISVDRGTDCDCRFVPFEGDFCERRKIPPEATFKGNDYLSYDLMRLGGEPIVSTKDSISLDFKTNRPDGLLFYTGDGGEDYLSVALKDGGISLSINLGSGTLDTGIGQISKDEKKTVRFDDDQWHHISIKRVTQEVSMTVKRGSAKDPRIYNETWLTSGSFSMLTSSKVFVGGSKEPFRLPGSSAKNNFVGCLRNVEFSADSLRLPILKLAKESNRLITSVGSISYECQPPKPIIPIAFTSSDAYIALPSWNSSNGGSISFKFRTNEPEGLLLYNGAVTGKGDFFGMEMLSGFLYLHLDLGDGPIKIRSSNKVLNDGNWHAVTVVRDDRSGSVKVDGNAIDFDTPGRDTKLESNGPLYIGGIDMTKDRSASGYGRVSNTLAEYSPNKARNNHYWIPPVLWTATLRQGFVGCLRDFAINGRSVDVSSYAKNQDSGSVITSCELVPTQKCDDSSCMNQGKCTEGWNRFICDCSATSYTGPTCGKAAATMRFDGTQHITLYGRSRVTEAEDLSFRFRTLEKDTLFVATRDNNSPDRLQITLEDGRIKAALHMGDSDQKVFSGDGLNDNQWHTITFQRRGKTIELGVDESRPIIVEMFGSDTFLRYSTVFVGMIPPKLETVPLSQNIPNFKGSLQQLQFNGVPFLENMKNGLLVENVDYKSTAAWTPRDDAVYHAITFKSHKTYMGLPQMKLYDDISVYFQIKTLEPNGLIMYNAGKKDSSDFFAVELVNGHIHYVLNLGSGVITIKDNSSEALNDNKWHTIHIGRPFQHYHNLKVDQQLATKPTQGGDVHLDLDGILFLGGVRNSMYGKLPREIVSTFGYQGCLGSLDVNGEAVDPIKNVLVPSQYVSEGCEDFGNEPPPAATTSFHPNSRKAKSKRGKIEPLGNRVCLPDTCANKGVCYEPYDEGILKAALVRQEYVSEKGKNTDWRTSYSSNSVCDCDLTTYTGPTCEEESVAYEWGSKGRGLIRYFYNEQKHPSTKVDIISLGFITPLENAVLLRVDSGTTQDYLEVDIVAGHIFVSYNVGREDIAIGEMNSRVDDGKYHVVRFTRSGANSTLQLDEMQVQTKHPLGTQLTVFNDQSVIHLGGRWNPTLKRVERPFTGVMAGIVYNGLRPLDIAADPLSSSKRKDKTSARAQIQGPVRVLSSIPFDYKQKHPRLFAKINGPKNSNVQNAFPRGGAPEPGINDDFIYPRTRCTNPDDERYYDPRCFTFDGSGDGDELITPVYLPPTRPPWTRVEYDDEDENNYNRKYAGRLCRGQNDEEDCINGSSGDGDEFIPGSVTTAALPPWEDITPNDRNGKYHEDPDDSDGMVYVQHAPSTTKQPFGSLDENDIHNLDDNERNDPPQQTYENYDPKYNVYDGEPKPKPGSEPGKTSKGNGGGVVFKAAAPGTILVIGIIAGALIAIILIVVIVLKMRTRSEGHYKVEETRTYQFATTSTTAGGGVGSLNIHPKNGSNGESTDNEFTLPRPTAPLVGTGTSSHTSLDYSTTQIPRQGPPRPTTATVTSASRGVRAGSVTNYQTNPCASNIPPGSKATVTPAPSSFYDRHVKNALNNINVKSVREWYV